MISTTVDALADCPEMAELAVSPLDSTDDVEALAVAPRLLQPPANLLLVGLEVVGDGGLDIGLRLLR